MADETTTVAEMPATVAALDTSKYPREFAYGAINLADPGIALTPEKVVQHYATVGYPEMTTATVDGPKVVGKKQIFTISRKVPSKG